MSHIIEKTSYSAEDCSTNTRKILMIMLVAAAVWVVNGGVGAALIYNMNSTDAVFIPNNGTLLGVTYNPAESEQDIKDLQSFEEWSGKNYSVVVIFQGFSPDEESSFPKDQLDNLWHNGNTPLLTLEPWGSSDILDLINNGTLDPYFEEYAQDMKNWTQETWTVRNKTGTNKQLFLRFAHEMNLHDEAYPWSNKSPASYKNAWKRVHDIFEEHGLTSGDVQWVWCVNNYDVPYDGYKAEEYYPGDEYVDWVGIDGYNTGESVPNASWDHWENYTLRFKHMIDRFDNYSNISTKPYGIFEIGSSSVVEANTVNGTFNVFTNNNSPAEHYVPTGWMGDWQYLTYEEVTDDSCQEISCGNSSIRITYFIDPEMRNHYTPSGWTGGNIEFDEGYNEDVYSGSTSIRINYSIDQSWAGVYWQYPADNWGNKEGGYNLTGAKKLTFFAKGEGGEIIKFSMGGTDGDYPDSASAEIKVTLTDTWQEYSIDLTGKNLSHIITGFGWSATQSNNPDGCTFYIDDIKYRYKDKNFSIYTDTDTGWAGIYWQDPANNWGNKEGGFNLTGATKLIFWAKGEGCEHTSFMMGGISGNNSSDTDNASIDIDLTDVWKKYVINLTGKNLSNIITGFGWVASKSDDPGGCRVYIDEIRYENVSVEVGVSNNTKKGEWITETYNSIKNHPNIKMICYFNVDKGGTKYLTGESDWAVFTTPRDNRNNIDDCSFDPNKRIVQYNECVKDDYYIYRFPLYLEEERMIYVDDNFTDDPDKHRWDSIQEGINDANDGYTIFVHNGTYYENVVVNKSLILTGENRNTTIIDSVGSGDGIYVTANDCMISGFTVTGATGNYKAGIHIYNADRCSILENNVSDNDYGIFIGDSNNNTLYHNNLINNIKNAYNTGTNQWNSSTEGNYYSDYTGIDTDGDGIGDTPYNISGGAGAQDRYPLMQPWNEGGSGFISIGSANAPPNSIITVPISVANVTNISGMSFDLHYNSSIVIVSSVSASENFTGSSVTPNIDNLNGITSIMLTNSNLISASAETPVIDIAFKITGGSGSSTTLDLQNVEFSDANSNPYTPAVVVDGMITVGTKGDFNGNGRVDIGDVAKVAFMVAGKVTPDPRADFNGNGRVDIGDAAKIAFYLAGKVSEL